MTRAFQIAYCFTGVKLRKIAPKLSRNGSLCAIDLDNEILLTSKSDELGRISRKDRTLEALDYSKIKPPSGILSPDGFATPSPDGTIAGADHAIAFAPRRNEIHQLRLMPSTKVESVTVDDLDTSYY
jgi:hypothetical protein